MALLAAEGHRDIRHWGAAGSDMGSDLVSTGPDGRRWVIQAKRVQSLAASRATYELNKLLEYPPDPPPDVYLLATSAPVSRATEERLHELIGSGGLEMDLRIWGSSELDLRLRRHPEILEQFFGRSLSRSMARPSEDSPFSRVRGHLIWALLPVAMFAGYVLAYAFGAANLTESAIGLGAIIVLSSFVLYRGLSAEEKKKEIELLEVSSEQRDDLIDFLVDRTSLAVAREELAMLRSERRANVLFLLGSFLLLISILCPVAAGLMYWQAEPLPESVTVQLLKLEKELGELPKNLQVSAERDWHVLASGLAFGFLCLAAARGILQQQASQAKAFFGLNERVNDFERLKSALEIRFRQKGSDSEAELVDLVVERLLRSGLVESAGESGEEEAKDTVEQSTVDNLLKIVKEIRS